MYLLLHHAFLRQSCHMFNKHKVLLCQRSSIQTIIVTVSIVTDGVSGLSMCSNTECWSLTAWKNHFSQYSCSCLYLTIYRDVFHRKERQRAWERQRQIPCDRARQWLSPIEISTTLVVASSSISLGLSAVASEEPHPRQAPQPQAYTCKQVTWINSRKKLSWWENRETTSLRRSHERRAMLRNKSWLLSAGTHKQLHETPSLGQMFKNKPQLLFCLG